VPPGRKSPGRRCAATSRSAWEAPPCAHHPIGRIDRLPAGRATRPTNVRYGAASGNGRRAGRAASMVGRRGAPAASGRRRAGHHGLRSHYPVAPLSQPTHVCGHSPTGLDGPVLHFLQPRRSPQGCAAHRCLYPETRPEVKPMQGVKRTLRTSSGTIWCLGPSMSDAHAMARDVCADSRLLRAVALGLLGWRVGGHGIAADRVESR
jgi:hypothetical protein